MRNEDPTRETELNIRTFKRYHKAAQALLYTVGPSVWDKHDAMSLMELLEREIL